MLCVAVRSLSLKNKIASLYWAQISNKLQIRKKKKKERNDRKYKDYFIYFGMMFIGSSA